MAPKTEKSRASWRNIQQKGNRGVGSKVVQRRRLLIIFRGFLALLLVALVVAVILAARYFGSVAFSRMAEANSLSPLQLEFRSDGVLTADWLLSALPELRGQDVTEVDPYELRTAIEAHGQVASATVQVSLPRLLKVEVAERVPILRMRVRQPDGRPATLLIARDGTVYSGNGYPDDTLQRLPGVVGLKLQMEEGAFLPVAGMEEVAALVDEALARVPSFFRHWQIMDLSDWDPSGTSATSLIRVQSSSVEEIVFRSSEPGEQVSRLAAILDHVQRYQLGQPLSIDLSYGGEAVIRYK